MAAAPPPSSHRYYRPFTRDFIIPLLLILLVVNGNSWHASAESNDGVGDVGENYDHDVEIDDDPCLLYLAQSTIPHGK
jgi:hypothetical protein